MICFFYINILFSDMNIEELRDFCLSLKAVTESTPFDEVTLVFKVGGKIFTLANIDDFQSFNVKCNPILAEELREKYYSVTAGYHMNKKHWNTINVTNNELSEEELKYWIKHSYDLVVAKLPQKIKIMENLI